MVWYCSRSSVADKCVLASRTDAPVGHFCLVYLVSVVILRCQTRSLSHCTVDVDQISTPTAGQVVVVVDTVLVASSRTGGLDAADDAVLRHHFQRIVDSLTGDDSQLQPYRLADVIGNGMRRGTDCTIDSQPLGSDLQTRSFESLGYIDRVLMLNDFRLAHGFMIWPILYTVKSLD